MRAAIDAAAEHGDGELWVWHSSAGSVGRDGGESAQSRSSCMTCAIRV